MNDFPSIKPLKDQAELEELVKLASEDGHRVLSPTHIFRKGSQIIGYASICAIVPLCPPGAQPQAAQVHVWFDTRCFHARDSFNIINSLENIARCACPARTLIVPCTPKSPFYGYMQGLGYSPIMETVLWGKVLT